MGKVYLEEFNGLKFYREENYCSVCSERDLHFLDSNLLHSPRDIISSATGTVVLSRPDELVFSPPWVLSKGEMVPLVSLVNSRKIQLDNLIDLCRWAIYTSPIFACLEENSYILTYGVLIENTLGSDPCLWYLSRLEQIVNYQTGSTNILSKKKLQYLKQSSRFFDYERIFGNAYAFGDGFLPGVIRWRIWFLTVRLLEILEKDVMIINE